MEQLESPHNLVNEIITILANVEDKESLENSKNILLEKQKLQQQQELSVKHVIEKLTASSEEAKSLNASTDDKNGNVEKISQLQTERSSTNESIKQIENDLRHLEEVCKQKEIDEKNLKEKNQEITNKKVDVLPKTKYYFSLFSNISHIRWDYNSKDDEIKGFVASLNDVKPFCLDVKQSSKYFTVNYLWDLIDA
ncbi:kinetochore protein Spc24 [Exaiptasia diaphana]|uniref:Kinetochore protein Spc24 n=1 Tax=Exaiptasia diaphana TaxID=2652724 RepID=A0A913XVZ9_EXADI|nr:kinetochore protein Spc24 [Exaiptasia diaphana]